KFSDPILDEILDVLDTHVDPEGLPDQVLRVLDPFAGVGRIHELMDRRTWITTTGIEIEPEWAACHPRTEVGDALHLPFPDGSFDAITSSPCYGNRMADTHEPRDPCRTCHGTGTDPEKVGPACRACRGR